MNWLKKTFRVREVIATILTFLALWFLVNWWVALIGVLLVIGLEAGFSWLSARVNARVVAKNEKRRGSA